MCNAHKSSKWLNKILATSYNNKQFYSKLTTVTCSGSALGLEDNSIADGQVSVSSMFTDGTNTADETRARLNLEGSGTDLGAWIAEVTDSNDGTLPWIQVDLMGRPTITGVILQGRSDADMWTKTYNVQYSQDSVDWTKYVLDAAGGVDVSIDDVS